MARAGGSVAAGWLLTLALGGVAVAADNDPITSVVSSIHVDPKQHAGTISAVNGSVTIGEEAVVGEITSVNGSIHEGEHATAGHVQAVNGSITLGQHATAMSVGTVNGSIHIDTGAQIAGMMTTVNGALFVDHDADVKGQLSTVNGPIRVLGGHVGGGINTVNGDIEVGPNSRVEGGIHVRENQNNWFNDWFGFMWHSKPQRIVIGPGAVVTGTLLFEREVRLYVSDRATIGPVQGAKAVRFTGDHPPED